MRRRVLWALAGFTAVAGAALGARRLAHDRAVRALDGRLASAPPSLPTLSEDALADLPEPAQRYLRHALPIGTPLYPAVRLTMTGRMRPRPDAPATNLRATETLAPRRGFVWVAHARMNGLPTRVVDHYSQGDGGVHVVVAGVVPVPMAAGPDVVRSARGRLVAEVVWCPTALVGPGVTWEPIDADRARVRLAVDGETIPVTIHVGPDGALKEVTLDRWGDVDGLPARPLPYGFCVDAEGTFDEVTIPTRLTGGWHYGTDAFDTAAAATFAVQHAAFVGAR